ncbi:MAG: DUF4870 domain-containing protein [Phycisphaeraceae bacterium]
MDQPPPESPPPTGNMPDPKSRNWAVGCHLAAFLGFFVPTVGQIVGPLIIWLLKRHDDPLVEEQGKESLNFQISITIYALVSAVLVLVLIGIVLLPLVVIFDVVMVIIASIKVSNGEPWRYPLTIRLVQ